MPEYARSGREGVTPGPFGPYRSKPTVAIHGSEVCFRKFLAAAKVYQADVIILGGDFAGKASVPVLTQDGMLRARVGGEDVTVPEAEWDRLAADIGKASL